MLLIISLCVARSLFVWLSDGMPMRLLASVLRCIDSGMHTPQIAYDIFCLAKVDFLQQVPHLEFHIFDHLANVGDVRRVILDSHVGFNLAHHVAREV
jgi:hypothetical protein